MNGREYVSFSLSSNGRNLSHAVRLRVKREGYQNFHVLCCVAVGCVAQW